MKIPRELRRLAKLALAQGWEIERTGNDHLRWKAPDGKGIVISASTPARGRRSSLNAIADLKRNGLKGI